MKKRDINYFISKAKEIHQNKYSYDKSVYVNYDTKLEITCPVHGSFWQTPGNHLKGKGCPYCNGNAKLTNETFIKKARDIWGDRFDYSKVEYKNSQTPVCIIDKDGIEYWQSPNNHLSGYDCTNQKMNSNLFKINAKKIHGDKYDYSKVEYINAKTKVCIICPEHGEFWQLPYGHLSGKGCAKCAIKKVHNAQKLTLEKFIKKSKKIHGDKYDYSKVEYENNEKKVSIVCPIHGVFKQTPTSHMSGHGCPKCSNNKRKDTETFIKESIEVHGIKYSYDNVKYVNNNTKVRITCPIHGDFEMIPLNFLKGQGCPKCGRAYRQKETNLFNVLKKVFPSTEIIHSYYNAKILGKKEIDIFFPKYNIGIEYQGEQHFKPIDFGGYGKERAIQIFEDTQQRDVEKKEICKKNGIKLFYFSHIEEKMFLDEILYHDYAAIIEIINQVIKKEDEKLRINNFVLQKNEKDNN